MLKTLYTRLALGLFLLLLAVGLLYTFISLYSLREYSASVNQALHQDLAQNLVSDRNLVRDGKLDRSALEELFALYMAINPSIEIYLLDLDGTLLSYSADPAKIKRNQVSLAPIHRLMDDMSLYPLLGDDPRNHDRQKVFSVTPVPSADTPEGYLYVVLRGEEYDAAETMARGGRILKMSAWALLVSLTVAMVAGLTIFHLLTRRLRSLTRLVEQFENSDMRQDPSSTWSSTWSNSPGYSKRWRDKRPEVRDEIDYLGVTFDEMARRIATQIEQLTEKDAQRRRLIAQVSHDLRTPLASMQGYIESLKLRRDSLSPQEQDRFLDIALKEGRRLSRLVDELFELAALEAREKQPVPEPFPLAELVHDVVQKHGQAARDSQLTLSLSGDPALPTVYADLAMTERVLDNLISNAIAYSPPGSSIDVIVGQTGGEPEVCVQDSGPGISAQDLPHIFDPFYRGEASGGVGHAGLGLAIARRIMTLQGGDIRVENLSSGGASFCIRLPVYASH
ncbi:sensor histidine kinase [Vreelandella boliviensis]|uniref:histidine kinase n=1 Tax=Vreelandella boliviensis LC1 TaxID=1072583 RepID=A0A265E418_9GAMM|nr:HAMP domain-containing sensor histidine kinase [Halomonas boliviensis]EHJ93486.1 Sensor protein srrB [Halomonas boliviensis LC1]OZT75988.1 sensor histidine kinase [Halomonas boliviensis LC1]